MEQPRYWRTDLSTNLVDDLDHAASLAVVAGSDTRKIKWLVLAIHCSVQSALICSLRGAHATSLVLLDKKSQSLYRSIIHGLPSQERKGSLKLAKFLELYNRALDPSVLPPPSTLPENSSRDADIKILNTTLRNTFQHFGDDGLSVEISGLPQILSSSCDIIEHLALKHRTMGFHFSNIQRDSVAISLDTVRSNAAMFRDDWSSSSNA